jgi:uncharacterized protein (TIGR03437 family)
MKRVAVTVVLLYAAVRSTNAQPAGPYQLAANDDASVVFLSTPMRQSGTQQPLHNKLFVLDKSGMRLYDQRAPNQAAPDVSGDGKVLAIQVPGSPCTPRYPGYYNCYSVPYAVTTFTGIEGDPITVPGACRLSQNGRYAIQVTGATIVSASELWDLKTHRLVGSFSLGGFSPYGRVIANDGTAVMTGYGVRLIRAGTQVDLVRGSEPAYEAVIDSAASKVVFTRISPTPGGFHKIAVLDIAKNDVRILADGYGDSYHPAISNDGASVLFVSTASFDHSKTPGLPQAFIIRSDGTALRQVTHDPAGVEYALLSGNGRFAIVLSRSGRLQRVDITTGDNMELVGPTLAADGFVRATGCAPGSVCRLRGIGFANAPVQAGGYPLPFRLGGLSILLNGVRAPLLWVVPEEAAFQWPWEAAGEQVVEFETEVTPAFERLPMKLTPSNGGWFWPMRPPYDRSGYGFPMHFAVHENYESLVLPDNPARPGEIIHLYAAGLGPVDPPVPTGAAAPLQPLSYAVDPLACHAGNTSPHPPLEVLFVGLAPAMTGVYQVSLRLPSSFDGLGGQLQITCRNSQNWYITQVSVTP